MHRTRRWFGIAWGDDFFIAVLWGHVHAAVGKMYRIHTSCAQSVYLCGPVRAVSGAKAEVRATLESRESAKLVRHKAPKWCIKITFLVHSRLWCVLYDFFVLRG